MVECDTVGVMSVVGVVTLVIVASVVALKILISCSSAWRCLDGSLSLPLLSLMILICSYCATCVV